MLNRTLLALLLASTPLPASADLHVNATRIVHKQGSAAATNIRVRNIGNDPSLIQVWVDEGNGEVPLEALRAPYFVTPPLFRLDAGKRRDIQIREADVRLLPKDRESLLWLNITDVPSRRASANAPPLEFAMRWRLKIFHRPVGLPGSPEEAPAALRWSVRTDAGGQATLCATNPTPYFVSLANVTLGSQTLSIAADRAQIPPFGEWLATLPSTPSGPENRLDVQIIWIDDKGLEHRARQPLDPSH